MSCMNLSVSNIAWSAEHDMQMYEFLQENGIVGLEIAPTRIFPDKPYDKLCEAAELYRMLYHNYGLKISSMQSIWYGRKERIFGSEEERDILLAYTKAAIDFASVLKCKNLVFGCPRNRQCGGNSEDVYSTAVNFFYLLGEYAVEHGTVVAMEANPEIYHTDFVTNTQSAIQLVKDVNSQGFRLNLDLGTVIYNSENLACFAKDFALVNHIHISEPNLLPVEKRGLHTDLCNILDKCGYDGYISLETKNIDDIRSIQAQVLYMKSVFGRNV